MKINKKTAKAAFGCLLLLLLYGCASSSDVDADAQGEQETALFLEETEETTEDMTAQTATNAALSTDTVTVYICGAIECPGVYELPSGSRVVEIIDAAGGLRADASANALNQARLLVDGEMIEVLTVSEAAVRQVALEDEADSRVNINTADADELKTLPGIGDSKAASILSYREEHGAFAAIEDIKNIEGIKDGVFSNIKDLIRVQ